jgi:nickel-dependent lactate racemase
MQVNFAFGRTGLNLELPQGYRYQIVEARSAIALADADAALDSALDKPIGTEPLQALAEGKRSAAISVCDITRPAPNAVVLPHVLDRLHAAGIARENVTILIATGLHRPATDEEIGEIVGREIASTYRTVNHRARERAEHRYLGETSSGTPVYIDERFMSADLHITLGFIEPHLMLGFSGGRKLVAPGLAAQETIKVLHSSKFMRDRRTTEGSIEDNPLHRELLEIARMARHDFAVDVALARAAAGERRPIAQVFAGDPVQAHARGVAWVSDVMLEKLEQPADAVITTAAGYPLDLTFYQAVKGVTAATHVVKPGGRILLLAACDEGPGAHEFAEMLQKYRTDREFMRAIEGVPVTVDQWQLEKLALATEHCEVIFYVPGLSAEYRESVWGRVCSSAEEGLKELLAGLGATARIAVIPEGPYVLARARAREVTFAD